MFDRTTFRTLLTPAGAAALAAAAEVDDGLTGLTRLRRHYPEDLATLAHLTVGLRRRAASKFRRASDMYFLPEALEQSTGDVIAHHKGRRFARCAHVADLGCGIGGDLIGLHAAAPVAGIDRDALRLDMARANLALHGAPHPALLVQSDFTRAIPRAAAFHWDPSRRRDGRRVRRGDRFEPPLDVLPALLSQMPDGAVCLGPTTNERDVSPWTLNAGTWNAGTRSAGTRSDGTRRDEIDGEWEAISLGGECRAFVLWTGAFRTAARRATRLPEGITLTGDGRPATDADPVTPARVGHSLLLPDPAVVRAHLVRHLAETIDAAFLDPHLAVLAADEPIASAWVRSFEIRATFPFSRRRLKRELAARNLGRVQFSRHGVAIREADLADCTRATGPIEARVFLLRLGRGVTAVVTAPEPTAGLAR